MMKMKTLAVVAAALAVAAPAFAESKATLSDVLANSGVTVSGRAEAGYDVANTVGNAAPLFGNFNKGDSFVLHQVGLNLAKTSASGFGGAVTLLGGEDARVLTGGDELMILQGYLSYTAGKLTVIGGRFLTLAGAEVIDAGANFNSSRGVLFATQPTSHNGVRATYKVSDTLSLTGGLLNSINPTNVDGNHNKAVELNAVLVTGALTNSLTAYASDENPAKKIGRSTVIDYVGTLPITPATTLALNADYYNVDKGSNNDDGYGFAAYVNHKLDAANRIALRGEYLHGGDLGFGANHIKAYTATFGHAINSDFELVAEARIDNANKGNNIYPTKNADTQYLGSIRGVYKF